MLRLALEIVGIEMCDFPPLLRLVFVNFESLLVQDVSGYVGPDLLVSSESIQMLQSLAKSREMVINLELATGFRVLLQFPEERKIFSRILQRC